MTYPRQLNLPQSIHPTRTLALVTSHLPLDGDALLAPAMVASITCDRRLLGKLQPERLLAQLAAKLGLDRYALVDAEYRDVPGHQFDLFIPSR